ncbi:cytoplasmic tRNA 2-thiolation protein 2 [Epargyreus clarus]|uniref:cytoplasmic tRNA 2-thiolation protein 2 n=1 Tax=Epargyreus clarus TaxID=520877 RepID=UPI003C30006B
MICRKCENVGTITIKKDYCYCEICYLVYINHKFRACIGKNKVITPNESILIGLSGGIGSIVLLDLIHTGITLNTHKKLRVQPHFVHLTGQDGQDNVSEAIVEQCRKYGFTVHIISMSNYTSSNDILSCDLASQTTSNDFIKRIKQNILASIAKDLKCRLIFTAENATALAAKLLSDLVIGRGAQVENDIGFSDDRHEDIRILRPLREITKEELQHYINIKGLVPACNHQLQNSLQSVIDNFVQNLEKESPATISTICKTADKIGSDNGGDQEKQCVFCKGKLDKDGTKLTAIQATTFSRIVSFANKQNESQLDDLINSHHEGISGKSMFPFIHTHLCYCCSRSYAEMDGTTLQQHIQRLIDK